MMTKDDEPDEALIGVEELAAWLGVSKHTVRKWVTAGPESHKIPRMIRLNGIVKFQRHDVRSWLETKAVR